MRAVVAWLRIDLRRRGRSLAVLSLLLALSGGLVLAVCAGSRRNGSALDRLRAVTLPATAIVLPNQPGFDWNEVKALPEVEALGEFSLQAAWGVDGVLGDDLSFPSANADFYTAVERPVAFTGRLFDNSRVDEAIASQPFLTKYHKKVGDTVTARLFTAAQVDAALQANTQLLDPSVAKGPRQTLRIVGTGRAPPWIFEFGGGDGASLVPTYAFYQRYRAEMIGTDPSKEVVNSLVRLRNGVADLPRFRADLERLHPGKNLDVVNLVEGGEHITNATSFERNALLVFALVAAVAALLIVGQAIVRYAASAVVDLDVLRALGMTRQEAVLAALGGPALAAVGAAVAAVAAAIAASSLFPIGVGAKVEPYPGRHADWAVLLPGAVMLVVLALLLAYVAAVSALGHRTGGLAPHRSSVAALASRLGLPVPVTLGTRLALEPGRGRTAIPVRPALVGAIAGVLGVVAATTFHAGLNDAVQTPERYGQTYQAGGFLGQNGTDFVPAAKSLTELAAQPQVAGIDDSRLVPISMGTTSTEAWELSPIKGGVPTVSLDGRAPTADDEIALGPRTARDLHATPGQRLQVKGERTVTLRVSGITFVPPGPHTAYDEGAWLTRRTMSQLYPSGYFKFHLFLVRFQDGANVAATVAALKAKSPLGLEIPTSPPDVANLKTVRGLPSLLGVFLAVLAIGAVGHTLATAVHRRRHDIAVLRALGLTPQQVRTTVAWQATTLAVVGLVLGIPLGIALGRTVWRLVAERTPVQYVPPLAVLVLLLVVPIAVLVANVLAAYPSHRAVRQHIGAVLRAE
ncbi:MAG: putative transport system permease protein [Pseudonocardiales bacterium]|nr:putative transport system permease protein [Pseudonocardiales bacterium]